MHYRDLGALIFVSGLFCNLVSFPVNGQEPTASARPKVAGAPGGDTATQPANDSRWKSLLPKAGLEGWEVTEFGGEGAVAREGDSVVMELGDPLTGINYLGKDFPVNNFELSVEIQRIEGNDFLCGLTFPVADEHCSFIAGGWGGGLVGISSVDGYDASENSTTSYHTFENGKWYTFRVRVDDEYITTWIDDKEFVWLEREGHKFSTRIEVSLSRPVGLCAFQSKVAIKNLKYRTFTAEELKKQLAAEKAAKEAKSAAKSEAKAEAAIE
ncbi:MAG: DUF1080 domain-containing protein [Planctomycetales bacterium]|nr:DUF1080 domain-containing protein [Planctomycetales bacterium]